MSCGRGKLNLPAGNAYSARGGRLQRRRLRAFGQQNSFLGLKLLQRQKATI
jgi:hypothetical protein